MSTYNRIESWPATLANLGASDQDRTALKQHLDNLGDDGWTPYQINEVDGKLVIFLMKEE